MTQPDSMRVPKGRNYFQKTAKSAIQSFFKLFPATVGTYFILEDVIQALKAYPGGVTTYKELQTVAGNSKIRVTLLASFARPSFLSVRRGREKSSVVFEQQTSKRDYVVLEVFA